MKCVDKISLWWGWGGGGGGVFVLGEKRRGWFNGLE